MNERQVLVIGRGSSNVRMWVVVDVGGRLRDRRFDAQEAAIDEHGNALDEVEKVLRAAGINV